MSEQKSFWESRREFLDKKIKLERYQKIGALLLVIVLSGFAGWLWEFCLQEVSGGFQGLYIKGGNLLPWINIYAYGAVLIIGTTYRLRKNPWLVFLVSAVVCGVLEGLAGWLVYSIFDGARYWNYLNSWWGFGSINGFVCPMSVIAFGLAAVALIYWALPWCIHVARTMSKKAFLIMTISLFSVVMIDDVTNLILKSMDLPTAMNLYESWGWQYRSK